MRIKFPLPQPQPTTPILGPVVAFTFDDYHDAKLAIALGRRPRNSRERAIFRLFRTFGSYRVKPKRGSLGVIFQNRPFYWSKKGYYRPGYMKGRRRPLQHFIWEHYHGRPVPPRHEIFARDRDRHNFTRANLELLSKEALHTRIKEIGELRSPTFEERSIFRGRWAVKHSRQMTSTLFDNFNRKDKHEHHDKTRFLLARRERLQTPRKVRSI